MAMKLIKIKPNVCHGGEKVFVEVFEKKFDRHFYTIEKKLCLVMLKKLELHLLRNRNTNRQVKPLG